MVLSAGVDVCTANSNPVVVKYAERNASMDYRQQFAVKPGSKVRLSGIDPSYTGEHVSEDQAQRDIKKYRAKLTQQQYLMYSDKQQSLLIVLQALDAAGKDGTVNHVMSAMNPQGTSVTGFKPPTALELDHDFLWRVHPHAPAKGSVAIFNRSHYEDVLVVRVHKLASKQVWSTRYELINDFEKLLRAQNNTHIIKFFLHISKEEQLARFKQRLDDPARNWKISDSDYKERELWDDYMKAFEDIFAETSTKRAPWYIVPSNHKWFRNLVVSQIVADTMEDLGMKLPKPTVDLEVIRKEYHAAEEKEYPENDDNKIRPAAKHKGEGTTSKKNRKRRKK
jgi:PPK2 family polyphosphate:nucleotide phosphotransferase